MRFKKRKSMKRARISIQGWRRRGWVGWVQPMRLKEETPSHIGFAHRLKKAAQFSIHGQFQHTQKVGCIDPSPKATETTQPITTTIPCSLPICHIWDIISILTLGLLICPLSIQPNVLTKSRVFVNGHRTFWGW